MINAGIVLMQLQPIALSSYSTDVQSHPSFRVRELSQKVAMYSGRARR